MNMNSLWRCFMFLVAARLVIESEACEFEAQRCEVRNPPWARNRRRQARKIMQRAIDLCGEQGLPWLGHGDD